MSHHHADKFIHGDGSVVYGGICQTADRVRPLLFDSITSDHHADNRACGCAVAIRIKSALHCKANRFGIIKITPKKGRRDQFRVGYGVDRVLLVPFIVPRLKILEKRVPIVSASSQTMAAAFIAATNIFP